jgi:hypothetical protein
MSEDKTPEPAAQPSTPFQTVVHTTAFIITVLVGAFTAVTMQSNSLEHDEKMVTLSCQGCAKHTKPEARENE